MYMLTGNSNLKQTIATILPEKIITIGHISFALVDQYIATHFLVCMTCFRSNKVYVSHLPVLFKLIQNKFLLLRDKQAGKD